MSKRTFVSLAFCLAGIFALYGQEENQNNYGVDEANTKFSLQSGVLGGETNYTYLSLKDHEDVSGVPLGGIGVGNINFAPSGKFTRIGMNNIHTPIKRSEHSFFSLWTRKGNEKEAVRLVRDNHVLYGMKGVEHKQRRVRNFPLRIRLTVLLRTVFLHFRFLHWLCLSYIMYLSQQLVDSLPIGQMIHCLASGLFREQEPYLRIFTVPAG